MFEEVFQVERVVNATGAGDATIAGFLAAFLRDRPLTECLKAACCVGAQCVQAVDALSGVADWDRTLSMIPHWPKHRQKLEGGWRYDETRRVWQGPEDLTTDQHR